MSSEAEVESVGTVLRKHILEMGGVKQDELASALGVSRLSVNELLNDKRAVTAPMALRLGHVLGTTPDLWLNLQRDVDLAAARKRFGAEIAALAILRQPQTQEQVIAPFEELFAEADET
ncbi:HigA family addiction module antitoxin [Sphingopyxis soli]|jgi:addiction module HigA family antidote|uniref:HigA family addiction module antitoxin n=1 Tax=Sphingopyxis soli TaxID=592051 RepID=A0ABP3XHF4_9SPHN|nr:MULTISPECIES: HigA family addiction module antitoxin [Sphingopyxis]MBJ7498224.1 HigA family addiction module antidote protein [Sphingopyxis sp.]HMO73923.1 HigA family addiction module antitoxin [Sphingopyxis sp.]HMP43474.1 HigA family addiction module antitoxin [Sphingopyxis sp.]